MHERTIFMAALEFEDPREREAHLVRACEGDDCLRARLEALLRRHQEDAEFVLDHKPELDPGATVDLAVPCERRLTTPSERRLASIGPYRLLEPIGEGGMGTVYVAEQTEPVRRRVALKVIKAGMDSRQVVARFEAERQALALMDHPNIARVLDGGSTELGRPFFVMELVHGAPITEFCDANGLTPRQRLELFVPVCHAIQHAHQKGVIHRDIKPSNVLVTMYDDNPVAKVIDFGVAKAIEQRLTDCTVYTQFGTMVGTIEYMSPEQAEMNALGVDTRSDVYSLGVLVYELLTGSTPLTRPRLSKASFDEIRRIIREEEPQRPSIRLSSSDELRKVAAARKTDPTRLPRLIRGDLDWIVMKCLEKDRTRRYETASSLARDIERHLRDEPVEARPPALLDRTRKFVRRRRSGLLMTCFLAAVAGLFGLGAWMVLGTIRESERKRHEAEHARLVKDALEQLPLVRAAIKKTRYEEAFGLLERIEPLIPDHPSLPELWAMCSESCSIRTIPIGADVWRKPYDPPDEPWRHVIRTTEHLVQVRIPRGEHLWRATKDGWREAIGLRSPMRVEFVLDEEGKIPPEMVRIPAGTPSAPGMEFAVAFGSMELPSFFIDRHEVTNLQYDQFVRNGGYDRPEYWRGLPFIDAQGRPATWDDIRPLLVDETGRPGPAGWRGGTYPAGEEHHPVSGVSWFEAEAYARSVGKRLPTIYHWIHASETELSVVLAGDPFITRSNFGTQVRSVRSLADYNAFGLFGTAGNVQEWCHNEAGDGKHFSLGGACGDPIYMPLTLSSAHALRRDPIRGFRCARYIDGKEGPRAAWEAVGHNSWPAPPKRDALMDDNTYRLVVRDRFLYDHAAPLDISSEETDERSWRHITAQINAAYRGSDGRRERLTLHLYLPKGIEAREGYQAIIYAPGGDGWMLPRIRPLSEEYGLDAIVRSGRAVLCPIYCGTYERRVIPPSEEPREREEVFIRLGMDLMRAIDYLEQRGDIDMRRIGYYGFSDGADRTGSLVALEPRIRAVVFEAGGLPLSDLRKNRLLLEWRHSLAQIRAPVLMLNGHDDPIFPVEESQRAMFELIGSSTKEHYIHPGGHHMLPPAVKYGKMLPWLDRHLGRPAK